MRHRDAALSLMILSCFLTSAHAVACTCNGKEVRCNPDCVQICTQDGAQAELCGKEAGKLLLSIGKETPSWRQIQEAARLFNHPDPSEVFLRDSPTGSVTRVPIQILRPFAGITLSLREASTLDALNALAIVAGVKLEIAGRMEGTFSMAVHDGTLPEIMDAFCESKDCVWSLAYAEEGWILRIAGEAGSHNKP